MKAVGNNEENIGISGSLSLPVESVPNVFGGYYPKPQHTCVHLRGVEEPFHNKPLSPTEQVCWGFGDVAVAVGRSANVCRQALLGREVNNSFRRLMFGRLLTVDLTTRSITYDWIAEDLIREYIGGSALAARLLWDMLDPSLRPAGTAPAAAVGHRAADRFLRAHHRALHHLRPLPADRAVGQLEHRRLRRSRLRFAGWDVVIVTGRAPEPVYLWIHNEQVEIRPAAHLWGQADIYQTQRLIREEVNEPRAKVACIGAAGENGVAFAGIFSDHGRAAARTGLGTLMGSKNLKALAVRGTGKLAFAQHDVYRQLRVAANKDLIEQNMTTVFKTTGTSGAAEYLQMLGDMPQKYWTAATFEGAGSISGSEMAETILTGVTACQGCVIACGREVDVKEGRFATGGKTKGPEYETICAFGSQLLIDDLPAITALGEKCDRLGMDTISAGSAVGLAYLLYDRGIISEADTGGLALRWGDP